MSDAKDASKIDRYVPGLTDGGWAAPGGASGYELFPDGFVFQSVMTEPIGVERGPRRPIRRHMPSMELAEPRPP